MKVVIFTGAGISAESGLSTFRDEEGIWQRYELNDVAHIKAWQRDPAAVLHFHNELRRLVRLADPNPAHLAIAELEKSCEVTVITQNVDNLHERAGSTHVLHLHGELLKCRSQVDQQLFPVAEDLNINDLCPHGQQLRPHVVWFGEQPYFLEESRQAMEEADKILAIGSSLRVYPAAGLLRYAPATAEKLVIAPEVHRLPKGFRHLPENAASCVPSLLQSWTETTRA